MKVKVEATTIDGVKAFVITPETIAPGNQNRTIIHMHGGCYVLSPGEAALDSLDGETSTAATMAREKYAAARKVAEDPNEPQAATKYDELRLRAIAAQRAVSELDAAPAGSFQPLAS
jgi:hypothetical protein